MIYESLHTSQKENFRHLVQSFYYLSLKDTQGQAVQGKIINGIDVGMVEFHWNHDYFT